MKARCRKCGDYFTLSVEEEGLRDAGFLPEPICDDCFDESETHDEDMEYMSYSDADPGL